MKYNVDPSSIYQQSTCVIYQNLKITYCFIFSLLCLKYFSTFIFPNTISSCITLYAKKKCNQFPENLYSCLIHLMYRERYLKCDNQSIFNIDFQSRNLLLLYLSFIDYDQMINLI
jgi:hypothetical protein